jgi:ABC-type glycerol-3-phosphate transport system permease component
MMFVSFYDFVPDELVEAAIVDGCNPGVTFIKIVFPLARNTIITIASMYSILIWNDFIFANTFISDSNAKTVAMGLKDYVGAFGNVDGCNPGVTFIKIVFPLARNTIITIASMYSILIWNDFIFANTFISDSNAKTVAMGLKDYVGAFGNVDWGLTFAAIVISILPPLIIYFALNKWVTAGMTMGATKG